MDIPLRTFLVFILCVALVWPFGALAGQGSTFNGQKQGVWLFYGEEYLEMQSAYLNDTLDGPFTQYEQGRKVAEHVMGLPRSY